MKVICLSTSNYKIEFDENGEINIFGICIRKENNDIFVNGEIVESKNIGNAQFGITPFGRKKITNCLTKKEKEYCLVFEEYEDMLPCLKFTSDNSHKSRSEFLSGKVKEIFSYLHISNITLLIYRDLNIDLFIPFKEFLFDKSRGLIYNDLFIEDLVNEMIYTRKEYPIVRKDGRILIRLKDKIISTNISSIQSDYINGLVENMQENEIIEEFSELTDDEWRRLFKPVWRANEVNILKILHKIDSVIYSMRAKNLYQILKTYAELNFEMMLDMFL